jgi:hypothetical protein
MNPIIQSVKPLPDYQIELQFDNGEVRVLDMTSYLDFGVFAELRDEELFKTVQVCFDSVEWKNGADLCPEALYENSQPKNRPMIAAEESEIYGRKNDEDD